jgi:hypothetical protein
MSLSEIKTEILKLSAEQKAELKAVLEADLAASEAPANSTGILGCMKGTIVFHPGWDEDEPLEIWEALRDDTSP